MNAREFLTTGDLTHAIERAQQDVRARPLDSQDRMFLFELLCFAGQWDRATLQLDTLEQLSADRAAGDLVLCRELLSAQLERERFVSAGRPPRFFIEPPSTIATTLDVWDRLRAGELAEAAQRLEQSEAVRLPQRGRLGQGRFDDFRDTDDTLAAVMEAFARGVYYWVPWEDIQYLDVQPPRSLRDLLWAPAKIALAQGIVGEIYLPCLYPGSACQSDDLVRLGRKTDWVDAGAGLSRGIGLKTFLADDAFRTIFELRDVHFDAPAAQSSADTESAQPA
jgi:type VI secretion system protein ImpE